LSGSVVIIAAQRTRPGISCRHQKAISQRAADRFIIFLSIRTPIYHAVRRYFFFAVCRSRQI
jgi:hypothetical protein